jgi:hypothetical protein
MNTGRTIFSQLLDHFPLYEFSKIVKSHKGEYKVKSFTCYNQWVVMAFAQLTCRESLRDIENCLRVFQKKLYHIGIRGTISRNTLANANNNRDWQIYSDLAIALIRTARFLYANEDLNLDIKEMIYAFDSTTIDLCLALFPWAKFRKRKAAIKLHTLLDLRGSIPAFIWITEGKIHDVKALDILVYEANAYYIFDRGYLDFGRLYKITIAHAFFVTRLKSNSQYRRVHSNPSDNANGIISDQIIVLTEKTASINYPEKLRRIHYLDIEHGIHYDFLTNNFEIPALTIAKIYKARWQVELFFKWIKQHLRIKVFYGTSENAVRTQIWIAISVYVLIAIIRKRMNLKTSLYSMLQILSVSLFEKQSINQTLTDIDVQDSDLETCNQLNLFE